MRRSTAAALAVALGACSGGAASDGAPATPPPKGEAAAAASAECGPGVVGVRSGTLERRSREEVRAVLARHGWLPDPATIVEVDLRRAAGGAPTEPDVMQALSEYGRERGAAGPLEVDLLIGPDGSVADARVTEDVPAELEEALVRTVHAMRFEPTLHDGCPVPVWTGIALRVDVFSQRPMPLVQARLAHLDPGPGRQAVHHDGDTYYLDPEPVFTDGDFQEATSTIDSGAVLLHVVLTPAASDRLRTATGRNIGERHVGALPLGEPDGIGEAVLERWPAGDGGSPGGG